MTFDQDALALLTSKFGDAVASPALQEGVSAASDRWASVPADRLTEVAQFLRDDPRLAYDYLNDLTVVDYLVTDKKLAAAIGDERLEVVYHLSSLARRKRLTLKVRTPRGAEGSLPEVPSLAGVWSTADWHEREAYDLFGVRFIGHPNLQRILCPDDWVGHPLRKDYQLPLEYDGIRSR